MEKFVTGEALKSAVCNILFEQSTGILLISPYIKLDAYFKKLLEHHIANHDVHLMIAFGKNEGNVSRSISIDNLEFFRQFANVTLVYVPTLHGKFYANDQHSVVTSLNLYDYSFENNIEFGVQYTESSLKNFLSGQRGVGSAAFNCAMDVLFTHDVVFARRPIYQETGGIFGMLTTRKFVRSETVIDELDSLMRGRQPRSHRLADIKPELLEDKPNTNGRPSREEFERTQASTPSPAEARRSTPRPEKGFCIRTGVSIPFNPERPMSYEAYKAWEKWKNYEYPEKYCHLTGKPSNGSTSMRNPVLAV